MKNLLLLLSLSLASMLPAQSWVDPAVQKEIEGPLNKNQVTSGKLMVRVGKLMLINNDEKNPAPSPSSADTKSGFILFNRSFMLPVYWNTNPLPSELNPASFDYFSAPGHSGNVAIGVWPLETGDLQVTVPELSDGQGNVFKSENIEVRFVQHLLKQVQHQIVKINPEMIVRANPVKLYQGVTRQVWLMINVPEGTAAGKYSGDLTLALGNKEKRSVKLSVEVLPIKLLTDQDKSFGWYCSPTDIMGLTDYKKHGYNSLASGFECSIKSVSGGKATLDFSAMDKTIATLKKVGLEGYRHIGTAINIFTELNQQGLKDFTSEYNETYKDCLRQMRDHSAKQGIKLCFWLVDEPRETMLNTWNRNLADTLKFAKLGKEAGVETYQDVMEDTQFTPEQRTALISAFDIMSPHCVKKYCPLIIEETKQLNKQLWLYNTSIDRFGFSTWKHNAVGRTEWAYNCGLNELSAKNIDTWSSTRMGDPACSIIYPAKNEVIPSPSFEKASQGIIDYRYVYTLEQAIKSLREAGTPEAKKAADGAQAKLDAIREAAPAYADTPIPDPTIQDMWRRVVAEEIVKLQALLQK